MICSSRLSVLYAFRCSPWLPPPCPVLLTLLPAAAAPPGASPVWPSSSSGHLGESEAQPHPTPPCAPPHRHSPHPLLPVALAPTSFPAGPAPIPLQAQPPSPATGPQPPPPPPYRALAPVPRPCRAPPPSPLPTGPQPPAPLPAAPAPIPLSLQLQPLTSAWMIFQAFLSPTLFSVLYSKRPSLRSFLAFSFTCQVEGRPLSPFSECSTQLCLNTPGDGELTNARGFYFLRLHR